MCWGESSPKKRVMGCEFTKITSDGVRVHHEKKERMGLEFTIRESDGVRVHYEKKNDAVRVHQKKERWGESSP